MWRAPGSVPNAILPAGLGARVYPNLWGSERLAGVRLGVDIRVSHLPRLVLGGPTGRWREGWVMPKAQGTLVGEQPYQAMPKILS